MVVPLWEWAVIRDEQGGSLGVSTTRHGAMNALSKALIRAGRPRSGHIARVKLAESAHQSPYYLRDDISIRAFYDGKVIRWM
jgi:hypothetical protein